jgi:hypothetical protein
MAIAQGQPCSGGAFHIQRRGIFHYPGPTDQYTERRPNAVNNAL